MEKMDPADAVSVLNTYLDRMVRIAFDHGGTLDRIVGDSVAIMFSAPVIQPDHRARALACALDMHAFAESYAAEMAARGFAFGSTRIGVHTGEVIVGNFGGEAMFDYRALGDAVNTAARLESVNRHLGTRICVSEATLSGCPGAAARPVGLLVMKGKRRRFRFMSRFSGRKKTPRRSRAMTPTSRPSAFYETMTPGRWTLLKNWSQKGRRTRWRRFI
jgi:adenylate cyclase